jgi:hypothetical protein
LLKDWRKGCPYVFSKKNRLPQALTWGSRFDVQIRWAAPTLQFT